MERVVRLRVNWQLAQARQLNKVWIDYYAANNQDFEGDKEKARMKLCIRGYPLGTTDESINNMFKGFSSLEYLYLMGRPKTGKEIKTLQEYLPHLKLQ